jgi:hypothetical protein
MITKYGCNNIYCIVITHNYMVIQIITLVLHACNAHYYMLLHAVLHANYMIITCVLHACSPSVIEF